MAEQVEAARSSTRNTAGYAIAAALIAATAIALWQMGRLPVCACGTVKLWWGETGGPDTSQHLFDWYTLSHIIHGFLFYGAAWLVLRRWSLPARLSAAVAVECAWEILENSPIIIDRYRAVTVSWGYYGDSIVNSMGDVVSMIAGFALAARLPVWATVGLGVAFEILAAYVIRDNLILNVIMLLWPLDAILKWQQGG